MSGRNLLGRFSLGSFISSASTPVAEVMASAGFDWLLIDLEHGAGTEHDISLQLPAVRAAGIPCFVRVESPERIRVGRALDLGADGVMIPRVESVEVAQQLVRANRFTPIGDRGVAASTRAASYGSIPVAKLATLEEPVLILQIESQRGVAEAGKIARLGGIDCLFVGTSDLTSSMGIAGDFANTLLDESLRRVVEACRESSKTAGVMARSPGDVHKYREMGFQMVALATDLTILARSVREMTELARRQT